MRPGKQFEAEAGQALKAVGSFRLNQNAEHGACDWVGIYQGLGFVLECKETHTDRLSFSAITVRERTQLDAINDLGGLGLVGIKWIGSNWSRVFLICWSDWLELEKRTPRSIPLSDGLRPPLLTEVGRVDRPNSLGKAWELRPFLQHQLTKWRSA